MSDDNTSLDGAPMFLHRIQHTLRAVLAEVEARPGQLEDVLEAVPEALVAFDPARHIIYANARAEAVFGHQRGELHGRSTDVLIPERLRQPDAPPMTATSDLMHVELPGLMRNGLERQIEWCFGSVHRHGTPIFVMTVRDRVELDRAMEALRVSEERFQLLVNGVRDHAIFMLDEKGRVSSWNAGAARIKGWDAREIMGQPYEIFFTPEDRGAGLPGELMGEAIEKGSREVTGWRVRKDGSRFWALGSLTVLRDAAGEIRGFAKVTRDLTERRQAEENERRLIAERAAREAAQEAEQRVRASEDRLRRFQGTTAALSEAVTPEDVSTVILRECLDALGAAGGALYLLTDDGREFELLGQRGHPDASTASYRAIPSDAHTPLTDAARGRSAVFYESFEASCREYPALRDAIKAGDFEASVALPLVAHGVLVGMLGVRFDHQRSFDDGDRAVLLTMADLCSQALERAKLYAAERAARANAESASRSKDEFLAMLGHELRNPLAPISTAVQLLKLRGDERSVREREVIERQVSHISKLVDDLLDVSRVARGLVSISRVPIQLPDVLSKAVEMASPLVEQREQHLEVSVPPAGLAMSADPLRLAQVVANLLANAAKFTPPGGHIWLSATRESGQAVIRVRDDGEGIGSDLLPHVFDLFVQGRQTLARSKGGLGLGLALVKSFITLHGGTVTAASQGPGRGSEFVVRIPALAAVEPPPRERPEAPPRVVQGGRRILVVDDNEDAREMVAEFLSALGHEVEVAQDGPEALRRLLIFPADAAILDLGLPVMDGFEVARRVSEQQAGHRPRLIALTGYGREQDIAQSRAAGFDVHLVKPVDMSALIAALDPGTPPKRAPVGSD